MPVQSVAHLFDVCVAEPLHIYIQLLNIWDWIGLKWYILRLAHKYNDWNYTTVGHNEIIYMNHFEREKETTIQCVSRATVYGKDETYTHQYRHGMGKCGCMGAHVSVCACLCLYARDCCWFSTTNIRTPNKPKHIESIRIYTDTYTSSRCVIHTMVHMCVCERARVCMCVMLCIQNHRFVWTTNINDASVYLDLSLLTKRSEFFTVRCFVLCVFLYSLLLKRIEYCDGQTQQIDQENRKKKITKLSHWLTTNKTNQNRGKKTQTDTSQLLNYRISGEFIVDIAWFGILEIYLIFFFSSSLRFSPFGGLSRQQASKVDTHSKRYTEVSALRHITSSLSSVCEIN